MVRVRDNGQYANVDPGIKAWVELLKDHDGVGCWCNRRRHSAAGARLGDDRQRLSREGRRHLA